MLIFVVTTLKLLSITSFVICFCLIVSLVTVITFTLHCYMLFFHFTLKDRVCSLVWALLTKTKNCLSTLDSLKVTDHQKSNKEPEPNGDHVRKMDCSPRQNRHWILPNSASYCHPSWDVSLGWDLFFYIFFKEIIAHLTCYQFHSLFYVDLCQGHNCFIEN